MTSDYPYALQDTNTSIHLAKRPKDGIVPGETFETRQSPIPKKEDVKEGECLVRVDYLSVDPGISVRPS
jgi:NADPH-dependent curcumin reductase CurA